MKLPEMGNDANECPRWWNWFQGSWSPWAVVARCTVCGRGSRYFAGRAGTEVAPATGNDRWLCSHCGAAQQQQVKWIGRVADERSYPVWEWLPFEKLPDDLRALFETADPDLASADQDARIRALVEVELVAERAKLLAQHAATCNCRKAGA